MTTQNALEDTTTEKTSVQTAASPDDDHRTQHAVEDDVLRRVLASFDEAPDARLGHLLRQLVVHLHAFIREVRLTEEEWQAAVDFLAAAGRISDERRQEFILLSDVLGASMQTVAVNNPVVGAATESTVFGPFFVDDAPQVECGGDIAGGAPGEPCWVEGQVRDVDGRPVPGARIEVWEADDDGHYDVQYPDGRVAGRGWLHADDQGRFRFWGLTPTPYPIPHDGPVGHLLAAVGRSPFRAPHLHFMVTAPGMRRLITHIFVRGGDHLDGDAVFGVKDSLIKDFFRHDRADPPPDGRILRSSWTRVRFDIVLGPATGTAPDVVTARDTAIDPLAVTSRRPGQHPSTAGSARPPVHPPARPPVTSEKT